MIKMDYGSWLKVNTILHFFFNLTFAELDEPGA